MVESTAPRAAILNEPELIPASVVGLRPDLQRVISAPIVSNGAVVAFALAANKPTPYDDDDVDSLLLVANLLLRVVEREEARKRAEAEAERHETMMWGVVDAMLKVTEARDPYTAGHQRSVGIISARIGQQLGLDPRAVEGLRVIDALHDLGKVAIPGEILMKPGKLSSADVTFIRQHSQIGADVLAGVPFPWPVAAAVLQHHEHLDGSGYPNGISGDQIIFEARVVAVADVLDAMSTPRPYRPTSSIDLALDELEHGAGHMYDMDVVTACASVVEAAGHQLPTGW